MNGEKNNNSNVYFYIISKVIVYILYMMNIKEYQ